MSQFGGNAKRFDPYQSYRFRVKWDGRYVAGISAALLPGRDAQQVEPHTHRDPAASRHRAVCTQFEAITLERGITHDPEFARWASTVNAVDCSWGAEDSPLDFRKDVTIDVYDEAGHRAMAYTLFRCWVSEYEGLPNLNATASAVAIQTIQLEHEGWERDDDATQPLGRPSTEPT